MSKRDFSKGFQVRKSKGGNKVRIFTSTQKREIEGGESGEFFLVRELFGRIKI